MIALDSQNLHDSKMKQVNKGQPGSSSGYGSIPKDETSYLNRSDEELGSSLNVAQKISTKPSASSSRPYTFYISILVGIAIVISFSYHKRAPSQKINNGFSNKIEKGGAFHETVLEIPFAHVDRSDYSIPANQIIDSTLFDPSLRNDLECTDSSNSTCLHTKSRLTSSTSASVHGEPLLKVPMPTGAFWTNLVLPMDTDQGLSFPIMVYPYAYKWNSNSLALAYPSLRRIMDDLSIRDIFNPDITLKTTESVSTRHVTEFDPLSVTLRYDLDKGFWETYLVQGSPWTTARYENATPILQAQSIFTSVECPNSDCEIIENDPEVSISKLSHSILYIRENNLTGHHCNHCSLYGKRNWR